MKSLVASIWVCVLLLIVLGGCSAMAHGASAVTPGVIPDLPEGWEKAGAAGLVCLVVLLFLTYLGMRDRQLSDLQKVHADRLDALARDLSTQFCKSLSDQQENCKAELAALTADYKERVEYFQTQATTYAQRLMSLAGQASPASVKDSEGMGS